MIPYSDLVAALRHWRARNGLPNVGAELGPAPRYAPAPMFTPPPPAAPAAPPAPMLETIDVVEEFDAHEIQSEDVYETAAEAEAGDFSMRFGSGAEGGDAKALATDPAYADPAYADPAYADPAYADPAYADPAYAPPPDDQEVQRAAMAAARREGTRPGVAVRPDPPKTKKKKR